MGKESRVKKAISFTQENFDVLEFLKTKKNASEYIINLIREDMEDGSADKLDEILKKLNEIQSDLKNKEFKTTTENKEVDAEVKNKILKSIKIMIDDDDE